MGPIVTEASNNYAGNARVRFVTFNFTSDETTAAAAAEASALGISEIYEANVGKTGFVLVYDAATKTVLGTLSAKNPSAEWTAAIDSALADKS